MTVRNNSVMLEYPDDRSRSCRERSSSSKLILGLLIPFLAMGCGSDDSVDPIQQAHILFQQANETEVLSVLESEKSPEAAYLRAVAFDKTGSKDSARTEINSALQSEAENPKYRAFSLRMQLANRDPKVAEKIITLRRKHPKSAAASLCAFFAFELKSASEANNKKLDQAQKNHAAGLESLKTAIALCDQIPEFQREMLAFAISIRFGTGALSLVDKLLKAAPDDEKLAKDRVLALLMVNQTDDAVAAAKSLLQRDPRSAAEARTYAHSMVQSGANDQRDQEFNKLVNRFPQNVEIAMLYAIYLTRSKRLEQACQALDEAVARQQELEPKVHLMRVSVDIPLEAGDAELSQKQLELYRSRINDPLLITYFEGRLLFLQNKHDEALKKLGEVVKKQKDAVGTARALAAEALIWMDRIIADKKVMSELQQAIDAVKASTPPPRQKNENRTDSPTDLEPVAAPKPAAPPKTPK